MKKTLLLVVTMTICFYSFCQMKYNESEKFTDESFSTDIVFLESLNPAKADSITIGELQHLNMQLREVNLQLADYRNGLAKMAHRRQSAMVQGMLGTTLATAGVLAVSNRHNNSDAGYALVVGGGVLCVTGIITWICSYTPLAESKVSVTQDGVVYKF